ncbi:MAG: Crp/Fnr family transcriptional regulator [Bacteroidales bacterium]|nr:Crp/Fnr family transcriptional regulator [Bacteroidales bacterium]
MIEQEIASKTTLLHEGETSRYVYFIKQGCLRLWFNNNGKDITFQFFFENQAVSVLFGREPSVFSLESIEPTVVLKIKIKDFQKILNETPTLKDQFIELVLVRMENYSKLFLSRIKDTPRQRYENLLLENPGIVKRIPQHYIASYLGITPVSLSRIRNRIG